MLTTLTRAPVRPGQRTTVPASEAGRRILMFPGERHGWVVMIDDEPFERHSFVDRRLALEYAKGWAAVNRPSALVVLDEMGAPGQSWAFK